MKKLTLLSILIITFIPLWAQSEKRSGIVDRVQGNDIIVKYDNPERPFAVGEKLHVIINNETVTIVVTFPMETSAKCRLYQIDVKSITKGLVVYDRKTVAGVAEPVENTQKVAIDSSKNFKDNGDGTITDTRSGLMWMKDANSSKRKMNLDDAGKYCEKLEYAGYYDWHNPSQEEFKSLFVGLPASEGYIKKFLTVGFENVQKVYWTSTYASSPGMFGDNSPRYLRLIVDSNDMNGTPNIEEFSVWPVRGKMKKH